MTLRRPAPGFSKPLANLAFLSLIASLILPGLLAKAEPLRPAAAKLVSPHQMNTGALLVMTEQGYVEAPRLGTDVVIDVNGTIARTVVTQRFENPGDTWLEGIYAFPLPEQAAVDALRMEIGGRVIEGKIKGRDEAKALYEAAKDGGQKASLVEQERPNIFTNSVANIGPHESVEIRIEYQETVKQDAGVFSLRFPLVVAPRYSPKPKVVNLVDFGGKPILDPVPDRDRITAPVLDPDKHAKVNSVSIQVSLKAGFALGDIDSAYHEIALKRTGDDTAVLALADGSVPADKDFALTWRPKAASAPQTALFHEAVNGEHYFLAMVTPPTLDAAPKLQPRALIFVIDNSGSMAGTSIIQARQSLIFALGRLRPEDTFNIVRFDDTMEKLFENAVPASSENLAIAKHFVSRLKAEGGTEMLPAIKAALQDASPGDTARLRQVVFLTDGAIGNEAQIFAEIAAQKGRSRLFTVGIGTAPNSYFMRRAAEIGRGSSTHIGAEAEVLERMRSLLAKLERPVMVGLKAEWPEGRAIEAWPNPLPDLYAGEPVVVSAKVSSPGGVLRLEGTFDGKPWSTTVKLADATDGAGVGKLWARAKIASLEGKRFTESGLLNFDKAIEAVALEHHLVSSQTSLVAIDSAKSRPDGEVVTTTKLPLNLPDGWVYDKVYGRPAAGTLRAANQYQRVLAFDPSGSAQPTSNLAGGLVAAAEPIPAPPPQADTSSDMIGKVAASDMAEGVAQPRGPASQVPEVELEPSTQSDQTRQIGMFVLLLIILSAVTLLMWRHSRRDNASPRRIGRRI